MGILLSAPSVQSPVAWARAKLFPLGYRYQIHPKETTAGLTAANLTFGFEPGDVRRYGAVGDGLTNDHAAFTNWALALQYFVGYIPYTDGGYLLATGVSLPVNAVIENTGQRPLLFSNTDGNEIFSCVGTGVETFRMSGIRMQGHSASHVPNNAFGGFLTTDGGLLTLVKLLDVRVERCDLSTFYTPLSVLKCNRVWIKSSRATTYIYTGILCGQTQSFSIDDNRIDGCIQAGAAVSYGIQATGDQANGFPNQNSSITNNRIDGVISWDGIGSHDVKDLVVQGNIITNCRQGIDLGHLTATNVVANLVVANNFIKATTTDTYSGAAASHAGITIAGFNAANRVDGITVNGNVIRDFFTAVGLVGAGFSGNIALSNIQHANICNNTVINSGANASNSGIYVNGTIDQIIINGNTLEGQMTRQAIKFEACTIDSAVVVNNLLRQSLTTDDGIFIGTSTIAQLAMGQNTGTSSNVFNSDIATGGSTVAMVGGRLKGSFNAQVSDGTTTSGNFTITYSIADDHVIMQIPAQTIASTTTAQPFIQGVPTFLQPAHDAHLVNVTTDGVAGSGFGKILVKSKTSGSGGKILLSIGAGGTVFAASGNKGVNNSEIGYDLVN